MSESEKNAGQTMTAEERVQLYEAVSRRLAELSAEGLESMARAADVLTAYVAREHPEAWAAAQRGDPGPLEEALARLATGGGVGA